MCGIVGVTGKSAFGLIQRMNDVQHHRGPDEADSFFDEDRGLALAMSRLAIIDVADGHQPMASPDGRFILVYNGEIFNAADLRRELVAQGVEFRTDHSDTEVLLLGLVRNGPAWISRLNGMFAFALYDRAEATLLCARDRFGIKPFYYRSGGDTFAFASELKSLLELGCDRELEPESVYHYFSLMYVPGEKTIFRGVSRLPAGHLLKYELSSGRLEIERYWRLRPGAAVAGRSRADWRAAVRGELERAVSRWAISDVPMGCLLSGGIDSAAVVGLLAMGGHRLKTFTVGFAGDENRDWNEAPLAQLVADRWSTDHRVIMLDPAVLLSDLTAMVHHLDEPYGGGLPSWAVFKALSSEVKVAMTGTGGDELFGNYNKYMTLERRWPLHRLPVDIDLDRFRTQFHDRYYYATDAVKHEDILAGEFAEGDTAAFLYRRYSEPGATTIRDRLQRLDAETQLPEEFLMMTDRFSMAHSVEARTPLLDHELAELVASVPSSLRFDRRVYKRLLREAVADLVPAPLMTAPKKGFVIPLRHWLRGPLRDLVEECLGPDRLRQQGIIKPQVYETYVRPHLEGARDYTTLVWGLLMFQLWHRSFMGARAGHA